MTMPPPQEITELLQKWSDGDSDAFEQLTPVIYSELPLHCQTLYEVRAWQPHTANDHAHQRGLVAID